MCVWARTHAPQFLALDPNGRESNVAWQLKIIEVNVVSQNKPTFIFSFTSLQNIATSISMANLVKHILFKESFKEMKKKKLKEY